MRERSNFEREIASLGLREGRAAAPSFGGLGQAGDLLRFANGLSTRNANEQSLIGLIGPTSADTWGEASPGSSPKDVVDPYLFDRRSLYKVRLIGTDWYVSLPHANWTEEYTNRALTEGALAAVINTIFMGGAKLDQIHKAYEKVVGHGVTFRPATKRMVGKNAVHRMIFDERAMSALANALNLGRKSLIDKWRLQYNLAKMIQFAIDSAATSTSFAALEKNFPTKRLSSAKITASMIRYLLEKQPQSIIEVAKTDPSTKAWRDAYKRNLAVQLGERLADIKDFDPVPVDKWAATIAELAIATRDLLKKQIAKQIEEDRKNNLNHHLMPHEIKVENAAQFIVETFEPTHTEQLRPLGSIIQGGQKLTNIRNEPIFLLRVESTRVVFQHLGNSKFYEQSLDGFSQEQLYSVYVAAGEKSKGAIALSKWVIGLAGAIFPPVRYGLMATEVTNIAFQLQAHRPELERYYDGFMVAYRNIDGMLPGVMPTIWDAVLSKETASLLNPLKNPDVGGWVKALMRITMYWVGRKYAAQLVKMENMMWGRVKGIWASIKKGADVLMGVAVHAFTVAFPVAGSTGVSGERALELAQKKLRDLGVVDAANIVLRIKQLSKVDQERLKREIQDLIDNGKNLIDVLEKCLSW